MNIMEIVSGTRVNGAILHCLLLSRELVRRGNRVLLVCLPGSWISERAAEEGIEVLHSDLHRWPIGELRRVARIARERRIDVVHTHTSRSNFFGVLLRWFSGVPSVATAHSRHIQLHWMFNDRVIAVSEATRRYHQARNFVRSSRLATIPNFIDEDKLAAVPADARARVRRELGVGPETLLAGIVGNVIPRKGLVYLARAMPRILTAVPDARLLVVGGGERSKYAADVREVIEREGIARHVTWTGQRGDIAEVLTALDLYVLPSLEESMPLSVLEAMASGLAVVATTVGGIPECVIPEQTGILVPPAQSEPLAAAVVELLLDPAKRQRFGECGRQLVKRNFTAANQSANIEAALASVVRSGR